MKPKNLLIVLLVLAGLLLTGCGPVARIGPLHAESQSVELGEAKSVRVLINFGAGNLNVTGGANKLMEGDFTYNVAALKPEVDYANGTLVVQQPDRVMALSGTKDFRNEWGLRLFDGVPMDLSVYVGAGKSDLQLAGLALTGLDIKMGAGLYTIDLSGEWARDLNVAIDAGAADVTLRLPKDVGARVKVETGLGMTETKGLAREGDFYTNAAYGKSDVTIQVNMQAGVGKINLEVEDTAAALE